MATTDSPSYVRPDQQPPPMTSDEVIAYVKQELEADDGNHAQISSASASGLPHELKTGSTLDLTFKGINTLPVEVVLLIKDRVERLALSHNANCKLPSELVQCDRLRYLNMRWNKLDRFPTVVLGLPKLEILDISKNDILSIPEDINRLTNLKFLAFERNQIKRLPLALGEMTNLAKLKFDENPLEFPPATALQLPVDTKASSMNEKEKELCLQVKKFLRTASIREKMRVVSEDDSSAQSESNVETPKPSRRGTTHGRFPVRPSMSNIDLPPEIISHLDDSPPFADNPPPYSKHYPSHSRKPSSNTLPQQRSFSAGMRSDPTDGSQSAGRSETVVGYPTRQKRQGWMPPRSGQLGSVHELPTSDAARVRQGASHSRYPSTASTANSLSSVGIGMSSSTTSLTSSFGQARFEDSTQKIPHVIKAIRRALYMLKYLQQPIEDIAHQLRGQTPKRSPLQRSLADANAILDKLGKFMAEADRGMDDDPKANAALLKSLLQNCISALQLYASVAKEVKRCRRLTTHNVDHFHVRWILTVAHTTTLEILNACKMLGYPSAASQSRQDATPRVSQVWRKRADTPTSQKSTITRRTTTVSPIANRNVRSIRNAPPRLGPSSSLLPLSSDGNVALPPPSGPHSTPRYEPQEISDQTRTHRSNTMRSLVSEGDGEDDVEKVFSQLQGCCQLAAKTLPRVRNDLHDKKRDAQSKEQTGRADIYSSAITACSHYVTRSDKILARLSQLRKQADPVQSRPELWLMCGHFAADWAEFASQVMRLAENGIDIRELKRQLKPLQNAVRDLRPTIQRERNYSSQPYKPAAKSDQAASHCTTASRSIPSQYTHHNTQHHHQALPSHPPPPQHQSLFHPTHPLPMSSSSTPATTTAMTLPMSSSTTPPASLHGKNHSYNLTNIHGFPYAINPLSSPPPPQPPMPLPQTTSIPAIPPLSAASSTSTASFSALPATPLAAALGQAAQTVLPLPNPPSSAPMLPSLSSTSLSNGAYGFPEYHHPPASAGISGRSRLHHPQHSSSSMSSSMSMHDRNDTVMQPPVPQSALTPQLSSLGMAGYSRR